MSRKKTPAPMPEPASRGDALAELGLTAAANDDDIRQAFRQRLKTAHPDIHGGTDILLRRLILARDLLMSNAPRGADGPERLQSLARAGEPAPLDISLAQAIAGGEALAEAAANHDPSSSTGARRLIVPLRSGLRNGDRVSVRTDDGEHIFRVHIDAGAFARVWGDDIWMTAHLPPALFVLGGLARIETPHGPHDAMIAAEAAPGSSLCLRGLGLPASASAARGDLYIRLDARDVAVRPFSESLSAFRSKWAAA